MIWTCYFVHFLFILYLKINWKQILDLIKACFLVLDYLNCILKELCSLIVILSKVHMLTKEDNK